MPPTRTDIASQARRLGFQHLRVAEVRGPAPGAGRLLAWLERGDHGGLAWMARSLAVRVDPRRRLPRARSAIVLGVDHAHRLPPDPGGLSGRVARYAWGRDYHRFVEKRLRRLRRWLGEEGVASWGGVDAAPVLERGWADRAGLGFPGHNCSQILPARGSWFLLAVLFVDLPLPPDPPLPPRCGTCTRCLPACPTGAFRGPGRLRTDRCIAYWTIEHRGSIPTGIRPALGRWVFGCDTCQEVCPHNAAPPETAHPDFHPRHAWLDLVELLESPDAALRARFRGTPLARPGPAGLRRNAAVVLGNLGDPAAREPLERFLRRATPVEAEHARWALDRLGAGGR